MQPQNSQSSTYPLPTKKSKAPLVAIILGILFIAAVGFGVWAYSNGLHYKNDSTQAANTAAAAAAKAEDAKLEAQFAAQNQQPYKTYTGSATYGSISFSYPKDWSAYVDTTSSEEPINGYFQPGVVPANQSGVAYALRVELVSTDYASILSNFSSDITSGTVKAAAYLPAKLKGVANAQPGTLLTGAVTQDSTQQGEMLVIKVRDMTLQIYTESNNFTDDFNNIILPSLTFAP